MSFGEAISVCLRKYVGFSGRARRSEYWWFVLFGFLLSMAAQIIDGATSGSKSVGVLGLVISLALFLPNLAVTVRRLHDTNRSGFWLLGIYATIFVLLIVVLFTAFGAAMHDGTPATNIAIAAIFGGVAMFGLVIWLLVLMCLPGTEGSNRFGPDPKREPENAAEEFR